MSRKLTEAQLKLARHALGLSEGRKRSYRNRYSAGHGTPASNEWAVMVTEGLANCYARYATLSHYELTEDGARAALRPGETLDPEDFPGTDPAGRAALQAKEGGL